VFRDTFVLLAVTCSTPLFAASVNITTANYDQNRTNWNSSETTLTPQSVASSTFGKVASYPVDGQIYAQPLYVSGVSIPGQGVKNVLYVVTMNDSVYAFDADASNSPAPLWQVTLGTPVPSAALLDFTDIDPQVGILSTPVIDLNRQVIYVVTDTFEKGAPVFRLHALSLAAGGEMLNGPVEIAASVPGRGDDSIHGTVPFVPFWHLQRPGLALANGTIYIGFGAHADAGPFHGWLIAYDAGDLQHQVAAFNTTPNGGAGGIWQAGRAPAVDQDGNVYVISGNGNFDGQTNFSGAVIKLAGADLSVLDWYTPATWQYLDDNDLDVGSTGAVLLPGISQLITGDKGGRLIYLDRGDLGGIESNRGANTFAASVAGIFQLGVWQSPQGLMVYEQDQSGPLKAYSAGAGGLVQKPASQSAPLFDSLYPGIAISSNGTSGGIVWETTGDFSQAGVPGTLHAFDAANLTKELWNSGTLPRDALGAFAKFAVPLVANGRVYVPTFSGRLVVYGPGAGSGGSTFTPRVTSVLNGASFVADAVSPGEVVAIQGSGLGPQNLANLELDGSGHVSTVLAGTRVWFDGTPAPVLYASSTQIGVTVPFGVSRPISQVVVETSTGASAPFSVPVEPASPALFSSTGQGSGEGAILNEDGSVNSQNNPALAGSIVTLYATGLGQTSPPGEDGLVADAILPAPNLPVSVFVGGVPAYLLYVGAAPGLVEGVFQINVRIPLGTPGGVSSFVFMQAGEAVSPTGIQVAVE
jgi:uncharacterized protein (TIGR03437 family)